MKMEEEKIEEEEEKVDDCIEVKDTEEMNE